LLAGAVKVITAEPLPAVAVTEVGAPGTVSQAEVAKLLIIPYPVPVVFVAYAR
jgi:hypothetical protein